MNTEAKSPFKSKTIWGAIVLVLTIVLQGLGVEFADGEIAQLSSAIGQIVGVLLVVWGRYTATQPISKPPGNFPVRMAMLCMCFALALQPGCALFGPKYEEPMRKVLEQGAKMALTIGLNQLGQRVHETRDYLPPIIHAIDIAFDQADTPEGVADILATAVRTNVPAEWQAVVLAELAESLQPDPDRPASAVATTYNRELAAALLANIH